MTLSEVVARLKQPKPDGRAGYMAFCPAHPDGAKRGRRSLSIKEGEGGKILLHCFAGCKVDDIVHASGLTMKDLFVDNKMEDKFRGKLAGRREVAVHDYRGADGNLTYQVVRYEPKGFAQRRPNGQGGWIYKMVGIEPLPYRLPELMAALERKELIFIAEGEKCVDALTALGLTATTNHGGAGKWRQAHSDHFPAGAAVAILPDNDKPGRKHADNVVSQLVARGCRVRVVDLPGLSLKEDVVDWLASGGTKEALLALVEKTAYWPAGGGTEREEETDDKKVTQSQLLITLADGADLFHTPDGTEFVTIPISSHQETWAIRSSNFRKWLLRQFYEVQRKPPGAQALQDALGMLEAKASFEGAELSVDVRTSEQDGNIYIDLCNDAWQVVEVSPAGWQVIDGCSVKFRRAKGMFPLPEPEAGGSIADLRRFVNVGSDDDWVLLVAWLVAALRPRGPYPVLVLQGEQGSAKSTTAKALRMLLDPSVAPLRTAPREERDLAIAASNAWTLVFDNLSGVPLWLSDALCRVATGGGFSTRTLYSDDEETIFNFMRPMIVNGIDEIVTRHDLLDRSLILNLPVIPDELRREEATFWREFNIARPKIFGALLDAVAAGLRNIESVNLTKLPRMADFAKWVSAAEEVLPWAPGVFMSAYAGNRSEAVELALEADAVAVAVESLLEESASWQGTATELLTKLDCHMPEQVLKSKAWPKSARTLGNRLRRCATFLRQTGIEIEFVREGNDRKRLIRINTQSSVRNGLNARNEKEIKVLQGFDVRTQMRTIDHEDARSVRTTSAPEALKNKGPDDSDDKDDKMCTNSKAPWDAEDDLLRVVI